MPPGAFGLIPCPIEPNRRLVQFFASPESDQRARCSDSGVFPGAVRLDLATHSDVKIPDIRIELRSKWIPGRREVEFLGSSLFRVGNFFPSQVVYRY